MSTDKQLRRARRGRLVPSWDRPSCGAGLIWREIRADLPSQVRNGRSGPVPHLGVSFSKARCRTGPLPGAVSASFTPSPFLSIGPLLWFTFVCNPRHQPVVDL